MSLCGEEQNKDFSHYSIVCGTDPECHVIPEPHMILPGASGRDTSFYPLPPFLVLDAAAHGDYITALATCPGVDPGCLLFL